NPETVLNALYNAMQFSAVTFTRAIQTTTKSLPQFGDIELQLLDLFDNPRKAIFDFYVGIFSAEAIKLRLFERTRKIINDNEQQLVALHPRLAKYEMLNPEAYGEEPDECVHAFLKGTYFENIFFHRFIYRGDELEIPDEQRFSGHWIVA